MGEGAPQVGLPRRWLAIQLRSSGRPGCGWSCGQLQQVSARFYKEMRPQKGCRVQRRPKNEPQRSAVFCLWEGQGEEEGMTREIGGELDRVMQ